MVFDRKSLKSSLKYGSIILGFIIMTGVFYLSLTEVTQKENLITFNKINTDTDKKTKRNNQYFSFYEIQKILIEKKNKNENENCINTNLNMNTNSLQEITQIKYLPDLIVKSIMAFLAGCILSEKKFFRFGII